MCMNVIFGKFEQHSPPFLNTKCKVDLHQNTLGQKWAAFPRALHQSKEVSLFKKTGSISSCLKKIRETMGNNPPLLNEVVHVHQKILGKMGSISPFKQTCKDSLDE